jgi:hypothetical protein
MRREIGLRDRPTAQTLLERSQCKRMRSQLHAADPFYLMVGRALA